MRIFVLGGLGFIGSALVRHCDERGLDCLAVDLNNYHEACGQACDILINANGNSKKFLVRQDPVKDFELSVQSVRASLEDFQFHTYVYLSSADVYPDSSIPERSREDEPIDPGRQTPYGFHKYLAEQCVRHRAAHYLIFRLSGFVGPGLKKNPIYDILHGGPLWVAPESKFQYLHTRDLARLLFETLGQGLDRAIINLGGDGVVSLTQVMAWCGREVPVKPGSPRVRCEICLDKLKSTGAVPESEATVREFLQEAGKGRPVLANPRTAGAIAPGTGANLPEEVEPA